MPSYRPTFASKSRVSPVPIGPLRALQLIEPVGDAEPFDIVPIVQTLGSAVSPADRMAAKVRWAERVEYRILTQNVPASFAPYNAIIQVSERGTEDAQRDYLAHLVFESEVSQ